MRTKSDFGMPRMAQRIQTTHESTAQPLRAGGDTAWVGEPTENDHGYSRHFVTNKFLSAKFK